MQDQRHRPQLTRTRMTGVCSISAQVGISFERRGVASLLADLRVSSSLTVDVVGLHVGHVNAMTAPAAWEGSVMVA